MMMKMARGSATRQTPSVQIAQPEAFYNYSMPEAVLMAVYWPNLTNLRPSPPHRWIRCHVLCVGFLPGKKGAGSLEPPSLCQFIINFGRLSAFLSWGC